MTILMCAQKLTDASLIYRTVPKTKTSKMKKLKQTDMLRRNGAGQETIESVRKTLSLEPVQQLKDCDIYDTENAF